MEYSISEIIAIMIKRIWIIVICVVLSTAVTCAVTILFIDKEYTASVSMYVAPNQDNPDIYASLNELNYAQQVVNTYIVILRTNNFLDNVAENSGLNYSLYELKDMVEMNAVNNTEIFEIRVTSKNPYDSLVLANTIARLAPKKIIEIKNADAVRAVDPATLPAESSAPNLFMNTVSGFVLGLVLGITITFLLEAIDNRIKDENDLLKHLNIPILGLVPMIESK